MKKKWIWLLLPAALLLLILLHVHSLARLAPSEIGRQVSFLRILRTSSVMKSRSS